MDGMEGQWKKWIRMEEWTRLEWNGMDGSDLKDALLNHVSVDGYHAIGLESKDWLC